jgi:hypothetical protein
MSPVCRKRYVRTRRPEWLLLTALAVAFGLAVFAVVMARMA